MRVASGIVLLLTAFRMAWPAFAYSIEDDREAQRTYSFVLTYVVYVCCWLALALGLLAPWILRVITTKPFFLKAEHCIGYVADAPASADSKVCSC